MKNKNSQYLIQIKFGAGNDGVFDANLNLAQRKKIQNGVNLAQQKKFGADLVWLDEIIFDKFKEI